MKRIIPLLLVFCLVMLLGGCAAAPADNAEAKPPAKSGAPAEPPGKSGAPIDFENTDWPVLSIAPKDYGIVYEADSIGELPDYPLDKLIAYYLGADGAFTEGAAHELYKRFISAPSTVLTVIALIGDETARDVPARDLLCREIAASAVWSDANLFSGIIEQYEDAYPTGSVAEVLACLKEQYAALSENTPD